MKEIVLERNFVDIIRSISDRVSYFLFIPSLCSLGGPGILVASGVVLLYISAGLALWSLVVYMRKIWRVLLR